MADDLEWLIVGGGIHGVHLAVRLLAEGGVAPASLRLLDPAPRLLAAWHRCAANTGMRYLRSPAVHHLDLDPWSLMRFAGANCRGQGGGKGAFAPPYRRPSVELFAEHCRHVIGRYDLAALHVRGHAVHVDPGGDHATVRVRSGETMRARRVLLAMGAGQGPRWPAWAEALRQGGQQIQHVFERGFVLHPEAWPERVAVIGGGISAAQAALRLAEAGIRVHLVARHALRRHQFDSDPGWVGPKNMRRFTATKGMAERRAMIREARHVGSMPPDVHRALTSAIHRGHVRLHRGTPTASTDGGHIALHLGDARIEVGGILLATGFDGTRPGGRVIDTLVTEHALPCAACGYPIVDPQLRWHPRVFVTGPLAELEIGPVARNIAGARRAAERIVPAARSLSAASGS